MFEETIKAYNLDNAVGTVKTVQRCDYLKSDACGKMNKTDEGYFAGTAPIARVGIMTYLMADGTILRELVPKETLFNKKSMNSLKMKPMTNNHPMEKRVDATNAGYRQVGYTGETVIEEDGKLVCSMTITDMSCIDDINKGKQELSPGYEAEIVFAPGVYENEKYDAVQVSRKYNHVAVVDNARGGTEIRMNLDGAEIVNKPKNEDKPLTNQENKMKFQIDGVEYELDQKVIDAYVKLKNDNKTANDSLQTVTANRDALKAENEELKKRDIQKEVNDAVAARLELERIAGLVDVKADNKMSNHDIKVAIIAKKSPTLSLDGKDEIYIQAVLDTVVASLSTEDNLSNQRKVTDSKDSKSEVVVDEAEAKKRADERLKNAWKKDEQK